MGTESLINEIIAQAQADGTIVTSGDASAAAAAVAVMLMIMLGIGAILYIFILIGRAMTAKKMGAPGWSQIIPVYSEWVLSTKAGCSKGVCIAFTILDAVVWCDVLIGIGSMSNDAVRSLLGLCSIALVVLGCIAYRQVARRFGKGGGFTAGLVILPFIFFMILGCGSSRFEDEAAAN